MRRAAYKNDNSGYLQFLIISPDPYFTSFFLFSGHNSASVRNILMIHGRII